MKIISILLIIFSLSACPSAPPRSRAVPFTVDLKSPQIPIDQIEIQFDNAFLRAGLRKLQVEVSYFPVEDAVCLQYRMDFQTYYQFWSRSGREAFVTALENYNKDYEIRNFGRGSKATKRQYGTVQGFLIWQTFNISVQAKGNMDVEFGYFFMERAPYFTVNLKEAEYKDPLSRDNNRTSPITPMYFTRAQGQAMVELFDQEFLSGLSMPSPSGSNRINTINVIDVDEY